MGRLIKSGFPPSTHELHTLFLRKHPGVADALISPLVPRIPPKHSRMIAVAQGVHRHGRLARLFGRPSEYVDYSSLPFISPRKSMDGDYVIGSPPPPPALCAEHPVRIPHGVQLHSAGWPVVFAFRVPGVHVNNIVISEVTSMLILFFR